MHISLLPVILALLLSACNTSHNTGLTTGKLAVIPVELTTHLGDQQKFVEGDEIQFLLSLGSDAYIYMYYVDAKHKITQILPNPNQPGHYYSAGYFLTIPEYINTYRFTISEPFGSESIWVFASDISGDQLTLPENSNSIEDYKKTIQQSSKASYGEYELKIITGK